MAPKYEIFGKYVLLEKVASGGMAEVYRAKAPGAEGIGKILAIKRILPQYSSNSDFIDMFKTEAKIAINLTQANIGQIYEFGVEQEQFFLLMEFIDGKNLRQTLSRCTKVQKALTIEQCIYIVNQVASGLDYAHRCIDKNTGSPLNIIHRDMSPQNIMVSYEGEVKIVDFGIAKAETKLEVTRAGTLKGKFGYMSPEQAEGLDLDSRTDIFSTGIVLWELLSGERLFVANNEVNTIRKIKECQIPSLRKINPHIHEELERITLKALAKDRNLRYQTAGELHRDLSRFLYRVNPEFTPHDLSITIKSLFKEDILNDHKRSLEFAKVTVPSRHDHHHHKENTADSIRTETDKGFSLGSTTKTEKDTAPRQHSFSHEINLDPNSLNSHVELLSQSHHETMGTMAKKLSSQNPANIPRNITTARSRKHMPEILKYAPMALAVLVALAGGRYLYKNFDRMYSSATQFVKTQSAKFSSTDPGKEDSLGIQPIKVHMMIHSIPAGAKIMVDGVDMGVTPGEIRVDMNKKFTLSLFRDGHFPFNKDILATNTPEDFTVPLTKGPLGYVNIDVQPVGADIYMDNQHIFPFPKYPVPAGHSINFTAVNTTLNNSAQQSVSVKPDSVAPVKLFLKRNK